MTDNIKDCSLIFLYLKESNILPHELIALIIKYYYTLNTQPMMVMIDCEVYHDCNRFRNLLYGNDFQENIIPKPISIKWPNMRFTHISRKGILVDEEWSDSYHKGLRPFILTPMLPMILIIPGIEWDHSLLDGDSKFINGTQLMYDFPDDLCINYIYDTITSVLNNPKFIMVSNKLIL